VAVSVVLEKWRWCEQRVGVIALDAALAAEGVFLADTVR
jgi:hypothetical protein